MFLNNYARWRIVDPLLFMKTVRSEAGAQARLDDIFYTAVRTEVSKYNMIDTLRSSNREIQSVEPFLKQEAEEIEVGRENIMLTAMERANQIARQYGIKVIDVKIKRATCPRQIPGLCLTGWRQRETEY